MLQEYKERLNNSGLETRNHINGCLAVEVPIEFVNPEYNARYTVIVWKVQDGFEWRMAITGDVNYVPFLSAGYLKRSVQEYFHQISVQEFPEDNELWALVAIE